MLQPSPSLCDPSFTPAYKVFHYQRGPFPLKWGSFTPLTPSPRPVVRLWSAPALTASASHFLKQWSSPKWPVTTTRVEFSLYLQIRCPRVSTADSVIKLYLITGVLTGGGNHGWKVEGGNKVWVPTPAACVPRRAKGRAGCWVREGVAPSRCEGITPGKFL